ncbi:protein Daple-like isoform X1 [Eptesicus fuscus]|uniref:protein Daple-like isoform X1 n=1 Tax=Eptesicus fuscus TaxID=29078 RepID=UPI002403EA0F|nr:protein Daple-like isoform X1 [Eptesicus fuscus]
MSVQCESLTRLRKDLEEERRHLWSQIDTLKELNQSLLEARAGTWTPNIDSLKTMLTGKAEEEDVFTDLYEAQFPAPRTRKRWSRGRAFLRFFHRQRNSSRGQAQSPAESPPGALEAAPACSCWLEDRDARRGPPPKATRQQKSAFWSRKKKDEVKDKRPGASSTLSNLLRFCTC